MPLMGTTLRCVTCVVEVAGNAVSIRLVPATRTAAHKTLSRTLPTSGEELP
jgi:hypothetical protein